uniref:Uncharacterized protein n=1 Tax=Globodera rostochiensis TaxID=31243 RepID=A0A914HW37_GLORO
MPPTLKEYFFLDKLAKAFGMLQRIGGLRAAIKQRYLTDANRAEIGNFDIHMRIELVFHLFMLCGFALSNEQKTKLCADAMCKGDLFPSNFIRAYESADLTFLKTKVNSPVKIVGFQFSERPDLLEAEDDEGKRGFIFDSHIDQTPYVIFLESALKRNQTLYMIERNGEWPKLIKEVAAVPELTRLYKTFADKLENYPLDKELLASLTESEAQVDKPRRMFREWIDAVRNVLPEPFCHVENTGLIILAFVFLSAFVHLINCLLSSNSGPESFDHRLLHDCITRLKEQELIIEKANKKAVNQHLAEAATDQLQKQNEELEQTLKTVEKRTLEFESENGKLKQLLNNTQHELEQCLALNTELKASVEIKDADLKVANEWQRELDRHGFMQQCTKLLQMMEEKVGESAKLMEEKEKKVERSEQEREKLRTRLSEVELGLLRVEDEKRELQHRIKELDHSLKQSNELNGQLENKHYHEERRLNTKIRQLDEQLANATKSSLGEGVSNSSDREVCSPDGARGPSFISSLWSEIDSNEPVVELHNSDAAVRSSVAPRQRMRSRSAGRQSVARLTGIRPIHGIVGRR